MIEINLLPPEFRRKEKKDKKDFKMPDLPYLRILGVIFLVLILVQAAMFAWVVYGGHGVSAMEAEVKKLSPDFERIKEIKLETLRTESLLKKLDEATARPMAWTVVLNAISDSMIDNIWLTGVESQRKTISFELPKKPERKAKPQKKGAKPAADGAEESPRKRIRGSAKQYGQRVEHYVIIRGAAPVSGTGTAAIGKFIQNLKANEFMKTVLENAELDMLDKIEDRETQTNTFDFTVTGQMKVPFTDAADPA